MTYAKSWKMIFAVPAVAGLMYVAGCERDEPDGTVDGTVDGTRDDAGAGTDPMYPEAETASGSFDQPEGAQEMSDAARQRIEQPLSNLEEALDSAEETAAAEGGTRSQAIDQAKEAVDGLRSAVDEGRTTELNRYVTQLQGMRAQLPANVQQAIDQLVAAVPGAAGSPDLGTGAGQPGGDTPTTPD